ncbi:MAG: UDP-N-acetylglucosamine--LPS N-acetylglucosamine transferase [Deltaproteobacteria bacterium]|nr:UDP-N-acetylglucosamine--LPS N-acetylglucosamine transferase [Deltaproteobacteria bacterium]
MRLGLITSSGGHLAQLLSLREWWGREDRFWVSFDTPDAVELLRGERVYWAHHPTNRDPVNLGRNLALAAKVLARERPEVLVSAGAGVALPFFALGRAAGVGLVFLEVFDRIEAPSLTGRLLRPWVGAVALQWEEQRRAYPDGVVIGRTL